MDFEQELKKRTDIINEWIEEYLYSEEGYAIHTKKAVNYSVRAGGKRLRPIILVETYKLFADSINMSVKPIAAALEMIHTYSLVHDDLPAMDNDMLRRGMPTTHAAFGEAIGILAGDALLNSSIEIAMRAFTGGSDVNRIIRAVSYLYKKAGIDGMIGGQSADIMAESHGKDVSAEEIDFIYSKKTGALLEAAMVIGCLLAPGSDDHDFNSMETAAGKIGMAFQIQDDILDIEGDEKVTGKPAGSDKRNGKTTYIDHVGIDQARKDVKRLTDQAVSIINPYIKDDDFLIRLVLSLSDRRK